MEIYLLVLCLAVCMRVVSMQSLYEDICLQSVVYVSDDDDDGRVGNAYALRVTLHHKTLTLSLKITISLTITLAITITIYVQRCR